ncbi:MAG: Ger(x)C family spore germination protein [Desulfitobacteriaceae bacterium]|nr:Ger(x)C family spore germination protein [Desulfitobacteriaceae bacterium]MDD4345375.1 Ger(x)C family spore germination protein [Desulfitobacteriaceae bacterium]MDD4400302.1 Ger(x)C family spore germination protein [Desulfitobacteriaceae bacterium]
MIRRMTCLLLSLLILVLALSGCWGKREVESLGFVFGIGIDKGSKPGSYLITFQIGSPKEADEGGNNIQDYTISAEGSSMREATDKIYNTIIKHPFVGTTKVVIIGEELAREGINSVLDYIQRYYQFRRSTYLVLAEGSAKDLLNIKLRTGKLVSLSLLDDIEKNDWLANFPRVRLGHYLTELGNESTAPVIPLAHEIAPGKENIQYESQDGEEPQEVHISGMGVFAGDKLYAVLGDEETRGFMWLQGEVKYRVLSTKIGNEQDNFWISARVIKAKTNWKLQNNEGKPGIHYKIGITTDLDELSAEQQQRSPEEYLQFVKNSSTAFNALVKAECDAALQKSYELGLDFLGIGRKLEQRNSRYWKQIKDQWQQVMPGVPVTVSIDNKVESGGSSFNPPTNPVGSGQ